MFPPMEGGLPGHTDRLALALSAHFEVSVLTSPGVEQTRSFRVLAELKSWGSAEEVLRAIGRIHASTPVLWQYVPHMYGRGGVNLGLVQVFRDLRRQGRRQVAMVHEIAAPFSWWPHRSAYALAHRWMWRALVKNVDSLGISTAGWLERLRDRVDRPGRLFLAPSPSNLPVLSVPFEHRQRWRSTMGLESARRVLGFFGTVGAGKQFEWVVDAWRAARQREPATALVVIGAKPELEWCGDESRWFRGLGYLSDAEASAALHSIDLLVLPFIDGVSERRSSFMAGLAHGRPVVTTLGPATGMDLRQAGFFHGVAVDRAALSAATASLIVDEVACDRMGRAAAVAYRARYDWPHLATQVAARLGGAQGVDKIDT
ncbi:MAG: glycosyltransferase [Verrucomicrobiales bacterium]|nr:glycosyltransferase [Verrucomicrobiales bacterium]